MRCRAFRLETQMFCRGNPIRLISLSSSHNHNEPAPRSRRESHNNATEKGVTNLCVAEEEEERKKAPPGEQERKSPPTRPSCLRAVAQRHKVNKAKKVVQNPGKMAEWGLDARVEVHASVAAGESVFPVRDRERAGRGLELGGGTDSTT